MTKQSEPEFLYLTTTGWKSGNPHEIEIWFTELDGRYYLISEGGEDAHWVQNIRRHPPVTLRVGKRTFEGKGRVVDPLREPELQAAVSRLSTEKYDWGEGLVVELSPD
ncbi:MAG TPA: nitroreductase family deazaflavin-dependent oxidoreductase [Anaerolineales bacterium]